LARELLATCKLDAATSKQQLYKSNNNATISGSNSHSACALQTATASVQQQPATAAELHHSQQLLLTSAARQTVMMVTVKYVSSTTCIPIAAAPAHVGPTPFPSTKNTCCSQNVAHIAAAAAAAAAAGRQRWAHVFLPKSYDGRKRFPMWVHLHGVFWASMGGIGQQVRGLPTSRSRV
jgi:hypothetical protein